jgi:hypothetical protein
MPWYRFTQREILDRAFWIEAPTLKAAREQRRADPSGMEGVPDVGGSPSDIRIVGRGVRETDTELVESRADELGIDYGGEPA